MGCRGREKESGRAALDTPFAVKLQRMGHPWVYPFSNFALVEALEAVD